ncbi:MAG: hypothetical protein LBS61_04400 [Endomicrobium sp.]|jgi:hypothetical protein|nr:hypothetical protein [Endomicrobium sp.]
MVKDAIVEASGGKLPNLKEFAARTEKAGRRAARPLYEKFYKSSDVTITSRLAEDPKFKAFGKKALASYNGLDRGLPG